MPRKSDVPTPDAFQFTVFQETCMAPEGQYRVYPNLAIERLTLVVMTNYAGSEVEKLWRSLVIEPYRTATNEDHLRHIASVACDLMFAIINGREENLNELVTSVISTQQELNKHMFFLNQEAIVVESSLLIDQLTRLCNPNLYDVLTVLTLLKDVQTRVSALLMSIRGTSLYVKMKEVLGVDENVVEEQCTSEYYRQCVSEKKAQMLKALQFLKTNINIPR